MELFKDKKDCTGCGACLNICPRGAIEMATDEYGFTYPKVDADKCIDCGLCNRVHNARMSLNSYSSYPIVCYGMKTADRKRSSSGGVATVLAKRIIGDGGVVYGVELDKSTWKVQHIRCESLDQLELIRGSKYVQSNIGESFMRIREDLKTKNVLFVGTPCQVEGLYAYLNKRPENLLTIDLVCHGCPSQQMFIDYINSIKIQLTKNQETLINYLFRDKKNGWGTNIFGSLLTKKKIKNEFVSHTRHIYSSSDPYATYFLNGSIHRPSCYECKFTNSNRPADITVCDFWGIEQVNKDFDDKYGVSGVIVNSEQGEQWLNKIKDETEYFETTFEDIAKGNRQLQKPSVNPDPEILEIYKKEGWSGVEQKFNQRSWLKRHKSQIKQVIPKRVKSALKRLKH